MCIFPAENFISCFETTFHIQSDVESLLTGQQHLTKGRSSCNRTTSLPQSFLRRETAPTRSSVPMGAGPGPQKVPKKHPCWSGMNWVREEKKCDVEGGKNTASSLIFVHSSTTCLQPHSLQVLHFGPELLLTDRTNISFSFWKGQMWIQVFWVRMTNSTFPSLLDKYTTTTLRTLSPVWL